MTQERDGWVSGGSFDINSIQYRLFAFLRSPIQEFFPARDEAHRLYFFGPNMVVLQQAGFFNLIRLFTP
jgi:hypothetical protein